MRPPKHIQVRTRIPGWKLLIGFAFLWSLAPVVMAFTVHNRCSSGDPGCVFHTYTLVEAPGPWVLGFIGAPALISLIVAIALQVKVRRRSSRAESIAWGFAVLSCVIGFVGLFIMGLVMLAPPILMVWAVAITPFPADPSDPLAGLRTSVFRLRSVDRV